MTKRISAAAVAAFLATALGTTVALAQGKQTTQPEQTPTQRQAPMSDQNMMGQGGMSNGNMMDMAQMNRMIGNCNRMMESSRNTHSGEKHAKPDNG